MATARLRIRDESGNVKFDSSLEHTLFLLGEEYVPANTGGITRSYSSATGRKIAAFLNSFNQNVNGNFQAVLSCRVSYPGGVPTVNVFYDINPGWSGLRADGYLSVFDTGAPQ